MNCMQSSRATIVLKYSCEDAHHYLFVCHQFTNLRRDLINSLSDICQPYLNVLLCGDISLPFSQNKKIFEAVHSTVFLKDIKGS